MLKKTIAGVPGSGPSQKNSPLATDVHLFIHRNLRQVSEALSPHFQQFKGMT